MITQRTDDRSRPPDLVALLQFEGRENPDKLAFSFLADGENEEVQLTYGELDRRAQIIAGRLREIVKRGDRALLVYPPGLDFIAAFFGCLYAGVVGVPVYVPRRFRRIRQIEEIIRGCEPSAVLSTVTLEDHKDQSYVQIPELLKLPWLATDGCHTEEEQERNSLDIKTNDLAFLQYTSGSTGSPKGVMVNHSNLMHNLELIHKAFGTTSKSRGVFWLPLYHDMGLIGGMLQTIYCSGTGTFLSPSTFLHRPLLWLQAISRLGASISGGPDFAYDLCVQNTTPKERSELDLSCWDIAFTGAEPIRCETIERFSEAFAPSGFRREAFFPCYGLAEATLMVTGGPKGQTPTTVRIRSDAFQHNHIVEAAPDDKDTQTLVASGCHLPEQRIVIADPLSKETCPTDQIGEIWVAGPCVSKGYYNANGHNETVFGAYLSDTGDGPFLRTGDLGFLRQGKLFVSGRRKDIIIIHGRNYCPHDIEQTIQQMHPNLRSGCGAAFSVEIHGQERLVVAQEVDRGHQDLDLDELVRSVRRVLAAEHEIDVFAVLLLRPGKLPRTSSGKVRRYLCREEFLSGQSKTIASWVNEIPKSGRSEEPEKPAISKPIIPKTKKQIQRWLAGQVAAQLGVPRRKIDITKPLFEFGMSSLDTVTIAGKLEDWIGHELSPTAVYNYPTIEALSGWLAQQTLSPTNRKIDAEQKQTDDNHTDSNLLNEVQNLTEEEMLEFISRESINSKSTKIDN